MRHGRFPLGLRTLKTGLAILVALLIVEAYGASTSKVIFALIGAACAMDVTLKASLKSCFAQVCGVCFGAVFGILMLYVPIDSYLSVAIGFILVTTLYNLLHLTISPVLPCIIIATILTNPEIVPLSYAAARLWDTLIGLAVGLFINVLFFPYDSSRQVQATIEELDRDLLSFLTDLFDGDDSLPNPDKMAAKVAGIEKQLAIMGGQRWLHHRKRHKSALSHLQVCDEKARALVTELEALAMMERVGHLTPLNRERLEVCGVVVGDGETAEKGRIEDIVTNYHVTQVLALRRELREELSKL